MLTGPDVSHWQGAVNWNAVKGAGHTFAFTKITDGDSYGWTGYGKSQLAGMKAAGLVPGVYHWLTDYDDPKAQAQFFVRTVGDFTGVLAALDVEVGPNNSEPTAAQAVEFAREFARLTGGHPLVLYTGHWYWVGHLGNPQGSQIGPLWHSQYSSAPTKGSYGGWSGPTFWQHTSSGSCPGIGGRCDLNQFYGDRAALLALTGAGKAPASIPAPTDSPVTPEEILEMPYPVVAVSGDSARTKWLALTANAGAVHVPNAEYYSVGVTVGLIEPVRVVSARQYDVAADLADRLSGV